MARTDKAPPTPSRYMRMNEVAHELGYKSTSPVYDLVYAKRLTGVPVSPKGKTLRVTRESFDAYCREIEAEAARRGLGGAA